MTQRGASSRIRNLRSRLRRAHATEVLSDLFDSPWKILIVAVVLIVLFGSAKLPVAARSLGKSMRILKAEVHDLHGEDTEPGFATPAPAPAPAAARQVPAAPQRITAQQQLAARQAQQQAAQQQIDDLQRQLAALKEPATGQPAAHRMQQPG